MEIDFPFSSNSILSFRDFFLLVENKKFNNNSNNNNNNNNNNKKRFKNLISASGNRFLQFFEKLIRIETYFSMDPSFCLVETYFR